MSDYVPYVAIYRGSCVPPKSNQVVGMGNASLRVVSGPFSFTHTIPIRSFNQGQSRVTLGVNKVNVPEGSYVIIESRHTLGEDSERGQIALKVAEIAGLVTLRFPQVLDEKIYEGWVNTERSALLWGEGPLRLAVSSAVTASDLVEDIGVDYRAIQQLEMKRRERFQLASRWFRRGHESVNLVDRFLFWWTVLEIYPGKGDTNIVRNVEQVLRDRICSHLSPGDFRKKLGIGRIYGERSRIVHEGRAFVAFDDSNFGERLETLGAVATICLRSLAGLPPGDELRRYISEEGLT